jgi:hypothetical protein
MGCAGLRPRKRTGLCVTKWALRRVSVATLALFFCMRAAPLFAVSADVVPLLPYNEALTGYVVRMLLALALLGAAGWAAVKFLPKRFGAISKNPLRVMSVLGVGRDAVYILQTGPDVVAFFVGKNGPLLLGRWSMDEWADYEASFEADEADARSKNDGGE